MLITDNYWVALCLTVLTMLTWGTNKIAVKYLTYPVSLYTIDFFTWVFIFHIILGFTLGADWFPPEKGIGMISNFKDIFAHCTKTTLFIKFGGLILGGISTMAFSLIMFVLTDGYGLTSAIPLLFGSAMLFGVVAAYFLDPPEKRGDPIRLFTGVGILFVAVILNTIATSMNNKKKQEAEETKPLLENEGAGSKAAETAESVPITQPEAPQVPSTTEPTSEPAPVTTSEAPAETVVAIPPKPERKLSMTAFCILGFLGALFDFFYAPCTSLGSYGGIKMSPYGVFLIVSAASFVSVWPIAYIVMRHPLKGEKCTWKDYFKASWKQRWPAIWSAGLLAIGNFCYATAGDKLTYAISYALSRGTLLVSALLGICFYHEFNKADGKTWTVQIFALLCFTAAIIVVASSKS